MASHISKVAIFRTFSNRCYSTQLVPISGVTCYEVKNTTLPNKLVVASADNESPITRISIVFKAGSRYETPDNYGVTHALRVAAGNSTKNASQFAIIRNIQQVGASLTSTSNRETISYTLEGTTQAIEKALPFLTEVATQQIFKPWEVADGVARMRLELATRPPQLRAVDLLHKAAYRRVLGNSLFCAKYNLGKISSETLQHYVAENCTAGRAAVAALGVSHDQLVNYASSLKLETGEGSNEKAIYHGGEIRSDKGGNVAYIAIAGEGGALKNGKEALAFAVLQRIFGAGPQLKRSLGTSNILSKAAANTNGAAAVALNVCYSDSGLFGALIAAPSDGAGKILEATVEALRNTKLTDEQIKRGKNQLKAAILFSAEKGNKSLDYIGSRAALLGAAQSGYEVAALVDSIKAEDVKAAFQKVSRSDLSIASVGNLKCVPFLDELE